MSLPRRLGGVAAHLVREALGRTRVTARERGVLAAELAATPEDARPKAQLAPTSTALSGISVTPAIPPHLNLLIGEVREGGMFAGVHTALTVAKSLAATLGLPLRILQLDPSSVRADTGVAERYVRGLLALPDLQLLSRADILRAPFAEGDVWLATHWKTAHAAQVAADSGVLAAKRVVYLIQDYEPGFSPWSTDSVLAAQTYRAGFLPVVNSMPLSTYLTKDEHLTVPKSLVFAPQFEDDRLREAAAARNPDGPIRVLFYARPSKPRNLFGLGVAALRAAVLELGTVASSVEFISAGEQHAPIELGSGVTLTGLGRLPWSEYFELLSTITVALTLQASPHPSHPPFDAAIAGATSVTNDFAGTRAGLHPRVVAVDPDTSSLARALVAAIERARTAPGAAYLPVADGLLGRPLAEVLREVTERLGSN